MRIECVTRRDDLEIRRLILEPGEATPWHTDPCTRFTVVIRGDLLRIEFKDGAGEQRVPIHAGIADWDSPELRAHRAVNAGTQTYEEIVIFFRGQPGAETQPEAA